MKSNRWPSTPIRRLGDVVGGGTPKADPLYWGGDIPFVTPPDLRPVVGGVVRDTQRALTAEGAAAGSSVIPRDSILLSIRAPIGYVARTAAAVAFNQGCRAVVPFQGVSATYLTYALVAAGDELDSLGRGTTFMELSTTQMAALELPVPPLDEQRAIADYLDCETARIDTLIEEQQRLIEMLRERRGAAVRHALLTGIDGVATKASGVELLGEIPKNWQMVPTRYLCTITTGTEDSGNATEEGDYPFYVRGREVLRINRYSFNGEAVMTPGDGQGGTGKVFHYVDGKFEAHQRVYVFKDFEDVTGRFFFYFLSTFLRPVALAGSNTVTMESLRRPLLADFKVAVPPLDEQRRIVSYLDDKIAKIDQLVAETMRFIELSRERRAALITAAVTGQIDVGEVA